MECFKQVTHARHKPDLTFGSLGNVDAWSSEESISISVFKPR